MARYIGIWLYIYNNSLSLAGRIARLDPTIQRVLCPISIETAHSTSPETSQDLMDCRYEAVVFTLNKYGISKQFEFTKQA